MELLAAYGSDEDDQQLPEEDKALALPLHATPPNDPHSSITAKSISFSSLPAPLIADPSSDAPAGRVVKKKVVRLPHATPLLAPDSDEDDKEAAERAAKRAKIAAMKEGRKSMLLGFLPPPVNDKQGVLGGGRAGLVKGRKLHDDEDDDEEEDPVVAAGRGDGGAAALGLTSKESYQVNHEEEEMDNEQLTGHQYGADGGSAYYHQGGGGGGYDMGYAGPSSSAAAGSGSGGGGNMMTLPPELMGSGIEFKEINAKDLRYVEPSKAAAAPTLKSILGQEFANKLRSEAESFGGTGLAKKKHQIGTLFANARANELDILDGKTQAMKSKSQTQSKYGW